MLLSHCRGCAYHEITDKEGHKQSKCNKENSLSIYTKCLAEEAVKQFIERDQQSISEKTDSALEICYETA